MAAQKGKVLSTAEEGKRGKRRIFERGRKKEGGVKTFLEKKEEASCTIVPRGKGKGSFLMRVRQERRKGKLLNGGQKGEKEYKRKIPSSKK